MKRFGKSQVAAFLATVVDFSTVYFLVEFLHFWVVAVNPIGNLLGALTSFTLGRYWVFHAERGNMAYQGVKYALVSAASAAVNTGALYVLTSVTPWNYLLCKGLSSILVGWFFNYPLHRYFVFRVKGHSNNV